MVDVLVATGYIYYFKHFDIFYYFNILFYIFAIIF